MICTEVKYKKKDYKIEVSNKASVITLEKPLNLNIISENMPNCEFDPEATKGKIIFIDINGKAIFQSPCVIQIIAKTNRKKESILRKIMKFLKEDYEQMEKDFWLDK